MVNSAVVESKGSFLLSFVPPVYANSKIIWYTSGFVKDGNFSTHQGWLLGKKNVAYFFKLFIYG